MFNFHFDDSKTDSQDYYLTNSNPCDTRLRFEYMPVFGNNGQAHASDFVLIVKAQLLGLAYVSHRNEV